MEYGIDPWAEWPEGAHDQAQAAEIRDLLELADAREETPPFEEGVLERLESTANLLHEEVDGLESRLGRAKPALDKLESLLGAYYEREG
jgi:hypothetical protein